ncbi:hypothetical protein RIF29_40756 [Crotalaria pallida]|uniref:Uncharacterized protein n=1 Tax=Crotalaria pallida TaxID=3830 RepID=A0AAN9EA06_CROPI
MDTMMFNTPPQVSQMLLFDVIYEGLNPPYDCSIVFLVLGFERDVLIWGAVNEGKGKKRSFPLRSIAGNSFSFILKCSALD